MSKFIVKIIFVLCFISCIKAEEITFSASINKNTVSLGEQVQITFTLNASGSSFKPPSFSDFYVLSGPNQSTSMQFINGSVSQSISYSYILQPKTEGTFKIGSATIEATGKRFQSNPITITITKGSTKPQANTQSSEETDINKQINKNLFLRVSVNKTNAYQGEEIIATYKIYTKVSLVHYSLNKVPSFNGFWSQDIKLPDQLKFHTETIDGITWNVGEIKKVILYPQRSGTLELDPMEGECLVRVPVKRKSRSNDPFDQFFNDPFFTDSFFGSGHQDVKHVVQSEKVKINVRTLPSNNVPKSFLGIVGNFSMESSLDKPETKTNEPITLKVKISGKGNLKLLDPLKLEFPPDIEVYDPKIVDNISISHNGISGSRTFEYLLIPRHSGEFKINSLDFSYFDPTKKTYINLSSPEFSIKVEKGSGTEDVVSIKSINKEDILLLGEDIRYIKNKTTRLHKKDQYFFDSVGFYSLLGTPFILLFTFLIYRRKHQALNSNATLIKSRRATKLAKKRLSTANKYLKTNDKEKCFDEIFKALWGYISDKLEIPIADLSKEAAINKLKEKNVQEELINNLITTLDNCEFARFAPTSTLLSLEDIYNRAIQIITSLEQQIK